MIDVVPSKDPMEFLTERYEFSDEEMTRRRAAIEQAKLEAKEREEHLKLKRQQAEQRHEEEVARLLYQARQHLDAEMQTIEGESHAVKNAYEHDLQQAEQRLSEAVQEQRFALDIYQPAAGQAST